MADLRVALQSEDLWDTDLYDMLIDAIENDLAFRKLNNFIALKGYSALGREKPDALINELSENGWIVLITFSEWYWNFLDPSSESLEED